MKGLTVWEEGQGSVAPEIVLANLNFPRDLESTPYEPNDPSTLSFERRTQCIASMDDFQQEERASCRQRRR